MAGMAVNWLFSLFFVVAELWGAVAISMLFWGLADDVCSMQVRPMQLGSMQQPFVCLFTGAALHHTEGSGRSGCGVCMQAL